eukprot:gene4830-5078_t
MDSISLEQRVVLMLRKQLAHNACSNVVEAVLTHVSDNILPKPNCLKTCHLQPISQLHVNAANACKYGILQALGPAMPTELVIQAQRHGDLDLNILAKLLSTMDESSSAWLAVQNLMSLQLFHLRRASAVDKEFKSRQLQQIADFGSTKACGVSASAMLACQRKRCRCSRSFELLLPVVDELVALV